MFDTLTPRSTTGDLETMPCARPDPGGFLPEARTGAHEAAAHMKDLAESFAELRNAIMHLPGNPSCDDRAGLAAHMKDLAERFAELRNAIIRLPENPSYDDRAGLRHRLLHLENTMMGARGSLDDVIIAIMDANDPAR